MKPLTRRSFIRWVITSGAALACPFPLSAAQAAGAKKTVSGESNDVCHQVRDGVALPLPPPSRTVDVVVVGAGPSGVAAADALAGADFLVLEKEPRVGGNAYAESWSGLSYSTGSAWMTFFDARIETLFKKWGLELLPIKSYDSANFGGTWVREFWDGDPESARIGELPYGDDVKKGFRDWLRGLRKIDAAKNKAKLDAMTFSELMKGAPEPLVAYWDKFGMSNYGADTRRASAYIGLQAARDWPSDDRFTLEGGLGPIPHKIFDRFPEEMRGRFLLGAPVYRVQRKNKRAQVWFFHQGRPNCVEAKAVVFCAPKMIAARVVQDLPLKQREAMAAMRYAPFPVYNLCFTRRVSDLGYDGYLVDAKDCADFIQADWVTRRRGAKPETPQVLTVYAPMREGERADLLDDEETLARAERAAREVVASLPGAEDSLAEVRVFRRGHPMPMSTPGWHTKLQPAARGDLAPIYFAHSDQVGELSDLAYGMLAGIEAVQKAVRHL